MKTWLSLAFSPTVVRRALKYAVVVGAILIFINHGDVIASGDMTPLRWAKAALTVLVPYCVSTLSSVEAMRPTPQRRHVYGVLLDKKDHPTAEEVYLRSREGMP